MHTVFKFGYIWVQHDKDQSNVIILQTSIYVHVRFFWADLSILSHFSNEGVTKFEKAVYFEKKRQKNNKLFEIWSNLYSFGKSVAC